jgi:hypothetical protein
MFDICRNQAIPIYEVARDDWVLHFKIIPQGNI